MKRNLALAVTVFGLLVFGSSVGQAITYWDFDSIGKLVSPNSPYANTFNIVDGGYDPSAEEVVSAKAWFLLADDCDQRSEWVVVDLGDITNNFGTPVEVDFTWLGGSIGGIALFDLSEDGILGYEIRSTSGDFWAKIAKLCAEAEPHRVPEGGATVVFLGAALVSMESLRRRFARK